MTAAPFELRTAEPDVGDVDAGAVEPAFVARIRLRAQRRALWLRSQWAEAAGGAGLAIAHDEVDRILADAGARARAERQFLERDPGARALGPAIAAADRAAASAPRLARLRDELALSDPELDLLSLAVAVEVDPWLRRAFGYLHDDATAGLPTPWLAQQLFDWPLATRIGADSRLVAWRLARPGDGQPGPWSITAGWVADPAIASWLLGGSALDARLASVASVVMPRAGGTCLYPAELVAMRELLATRDDVATPIEIVVGGAPGSGRRTFAGQLARELATPLLVVDAGRLVPSATDPALAADAITLAVRSARLLGAAVYWHDADHAAIRSAIGRVPLAFFGQSAGAAAPSTDDTVVARGVVRLPGLTREDRVRLWTSLAPATPVPAPVLDWPLLPGDVARAAALAPTGTDAVIAACRPALRLNGVALATRLARPYTWDDFVLPPTVRHHLDEIEAQARHRWTVYEEWGFGRLTPMGRGLAALFAGPSGTGKTMAAQVLARSLDLEIYRIDLAGLMSKYIGETEKNLRTIFDACEHANVLLFFDEADALFGQRTEVKDAHDRFANIEIDYLLQRMEQFDGIAILATNRRGDIDSAFLRRVRFIVDFLPPGVDERRALWRLSLPPERPDGEPLLEAIDWDALAVRLDMTGADIKAAAISAAFLAREEGTRIGMRHLFHAARRELAKRGIVVRGDRS
jgi:AAA+ superfamily predicted ATPase